MFKFKSIVLVKVIASFLLPPSCMVAPIGKHSEYIHFFPTNFNTSTMALNDKFSLPTMSSANGIGMDILTGQASTTEFKVRGRSLISSVNLSRNSSMASSGRLTPYYDRMDTDMDFNPPTEEPNLELSYKMEQEKALWISMAANQQETIRPLNVHNEAPPTHAPHEEETINI